MTPDYIAMGARIRKLRQQHGLSQATLANKVGLSTSFMGHIERGSRVLSVSSLLALSRALGTSTDFLITGDPSSPADLNLTDQQIKALQEFRRALADDWLK